MRPRCLSTVALVLVPAFFSGLYSQSAAQTFTQQGSKLVGTGAAGPAAQGNSVALSGDGNTALVGGFDDNNTAGAAWVNTRTGGVWTQQGNKLVGTDVATTNALQGISVALSGDGNTALVGALFDGGPGAARVFTRTGGVWTQQGSKLVGTGATGQALQGTSVALSGDGNTALVGGQGDNNGAGAAWVYMRTGGVWSQQGSKLVGTGAAGSTVSQGQSVALSGDGNTAVVGGPDDNNGAGAVWVYTRTGGVWTQQGSKLVGTGALGSAVALSGDGNTAFVGAQNDNGTGAARVFTRTGGVWSQQGGKLVGTGAAGPLSAFQGNSVALSVDGNTALVGGPGDSFNSGATWVYKRTGGVWTQQGSKLVGTGAAGQATQGNAVALSGDGNTALVGGPGDNFNTGAAWPFTAGQLDNTPPVIVPQISGTLGNNGWYRSSVTVSWTVTDPESGIASSSGCEPTTLTADTAGETLTCSATNGAGLSASVPVTIKIDQTAPVISGLPAPGCSIWPPNHKLVHVATVTASDHLSGIAHGSFTVTGTSNDPTNGAIVISGGPNQFNVQLGADKGLIYTLIATARDLAGNITTRQATCTVPHDQRQ